MEEGRPRQRRAEEEEEEQPAEDVVSCQRVLPHESGCEATVGFWSTTAWVRDEEGAGVRAALDAVRERETKGASQTLMKRQQRDTLGFWGGCSRVLGGWGGGGGHSALAVQVA